MIEKYAVAFGVNDAKRLIRDSSPYYKEIKLKVVERNNVLISGIKQQDK
jgi:hypothetical protein